MIINNIKVQNDGYIFCKSRFYSSQDVISESSTYTFSTGVNKLIGEIDSGVWAVSYLLAMYPHKPKDFILFNQPEVTVNNSVVSLKEISNYSCYMDESYPIFSGKSSVRKLVLKGLEKEKSEYTAEDIRRLFHIDSERFDRSLTGVGNEIFKAMAAIGYAHGKQIFCFPWLSKMRFDGYHKNMTGLLDILESLEKIVILPIGR